MGTRSDPRGQLDLLLLSAVSSGPAHGYRVIERLRERSAGAFDLREGTVYPALHRLERDGLLESRWADDAPRRRRVYALTPRGGGALELKRREWSSFAGAVQAVITG
jgi:PadR family transcriptional regulator, regulatory protein PadR